MRSRSINLLVILAVFLSLLGGAGVVTSARAKTNDLIPVTEAMLHEDGSLNLPPDFSGSLDLDGWDVQLDTTRGPVFRPPQAAIPGTWSALGTGLNNQVLSIAISGTDVYAGGAFTDAGGDANADYIAKWNGSAWSALGTGLNNPVFSAISGTDVYVGGAFTDAGGDANADYIAKWDGSTWSVLGGGLNGTVRSIAISGTDVYAGGAFRDAGGDLNADYIAKWNGSSWSALGGGLNSYVFPIAISGTDVYAGGAFRDAGGDANADYIAKWNGSSWSALGTTPLNDRVNAIAISGTDVYAGGIFFGVGGDANANYIAKWDGSAWSALGGGLNSYVLSIAISGTDMYVGGEFTDAGGDANADFIAKWNGSAWSVLGTSPLNDVVNAIAINGADVYAGGFFLDAGGDANADFIAKFKLDPVSIEPTFDDVPVNYWAWQYIEAIYNAGITGGCSTSPMEYCPTDTVTRAQMAVFLLRGIHGRGYIPPAATGAVFGDVPADLWSAKWIEQLSAEGLTNGCGDGNYCPDVVITRAEMAVFLLRAKYGKDYVPPTATGAIFADVSAEYWAAGWIEQLLHDGIAKGCGNNSFCPDGNVTRDQMAVFLQKTFNLSLP